ncbi:MAG: 2-hydroxychromene-2-carboxylate isomerase [Stackebrandtia sp.]
MTTARTRPSKFYFSLRSPYSWLAWRDLLSQFPDVAEEVEWRPFWEPDRLSLDLLTEAGGDFVYTPMSREKHLYILQDVRRLAAERGLTVAWPADRAPVWEVPHLAYLAAGKHGRGREFIAAAYEARWEHGEDICSPAIVADIAGTIGLDPEELATAAESPALRAEGVGRLRDIDADGVFGVPFFVHGYAKYWGMDRLPRFAAAVREQAASRPSVMTLADGALIEAGGRTTDWGHEGGCG